MDPVIKVIIPARDEERALPKVLRAIPDFISEVIVVDNGSTDETAVVAQDHGAKVIYVKEPGYGRACLAGIAAAGHADILVFLDGDASDFPENMSELVEPIILNEADFVLGSRLTGEAEQGSLTLPQRFGNQLACFLMRLFWGSRFTDLGPFRAIRCSALRHLNMQAPTFGWTVEMQIRVLKSKMRYREIPVRYRKRIGTSKISGTVKGVILAGYYILGTIFLEAFLPMEIYKAPKPKAPVRV